MRLYFLSGWARERSGFDPLSMGGKATTSSMVCQLGEKGGGWWSSHFGSGGERETWA